MKKRKHHLDIGATEYITNRMMEAKKGLGRRGVKGYTEDCFLFYSVFYSKKSEKSVIDVGTDIIGMVKTNKKGF